MKTLAAVLMGLVAGNLLRAADDAPQENEKQILGTWQAGNTVVEFLPEGKARIVDHGETKEGSYELNGDWLFVRPEGGNEKSGLVFIEGDRMTVDEHEFRRVRPLDSGRLIGKWTSDRADVEMRADGTVTVLEKSSDKAKSGSVVKPEGKAKNGTYRVEGSVLTVKMEDGTERGFTVGLEDGVLVLDGELRLTREGTAPEPVAVVVDVSDMAEGASGPVGTSPRYESALDAFLEARKNLVMIAAKGLGAKHPKSVGAIVEARFLLKRCFEEAELLRVPDTVETEVLKRLDYYGDAFEKEIANWGSR